MPSLHGASLFSHPSHLRFWHVVVLHRLMVYIIRELGALNCIILDRNLSSTGYCRHSLCSKKEVMTVSFYDAISRILI